MKRALLAIGCLLLSACSHQVSNIEHSSQATNNQTSIPPQGWAAQVVWSLSQQNAAIAKDVPIVVTTPVTASDFEQTGSFTGQIQQELMTAFSRAGFTVAEPNMTDRLMIKKQGEFVLSRDWRELSGNVEIGYLAITTYSLGLSSVKFNTRLVNIENNQVIAAESSMVPAEALSQFLSISETVVEKDGLLYRNEAAGMERLTDRKVKP